ncbi:MAG: LacI family DNA-binding transcriptional regulator [Micrococcales bacterium]
MSAEKPGKPTINDVAEKAGVSRATASRAISNYGRINPETQEHVRKVAAELGYRPNELARAMRRGKTKTIGLVIIADFTNAFFDRATKGVVDAAKELGYQVLIANTDEDISAERNAVATLIEKQVDGLIVVPSNSVVHDHLSPDALEGKPVVLIDRRLDGVRLTSVTTDDFTGAVAAVRHAASLGHRRMGFLVAAPGVVGTTTDRPAVLISSVEDRVNGFASAYVDTPKSGKTATWIYCQDLPSVTERAVMSMLDQPKPPTVIFTSNNDMALAVLKVTGNRQLALGRDISLVTFDDSQWLEAMSPGITVVSRPVEELSQIAVSKLIAEIDEPGQPKEKISLPTELIARGSVANLILRPESDSISTKGVSF